MKKPGPGPRNYPKPWLKRNAELKSPPSTQAAFTFTVPKIERAPVTGGTGLVYDERCLGHRANYRHVEVAFRPRPLGGSPFSVP